MTSNDDGGFVDHGAKYVNLGPFNVHHASDYVRAKQVVNDGVPSVLYDTRVKVYPKDVQHLAIAICVDDTGNHYLEGFIKTARCCRVSWLQARMGYALFKSISSPQAAVKEMHSNFQVHEQGDAASF
jgi:hypothetical protein